MKRKTNKSIKKYLIMFLVCLCIIYSIDVSPVKAENDFEIAAVIVTSDYKEVYDKQVNILFDNKEVYIDLENLSFFTGFSYEMQDNSILLQRSFKEVEINISNKTISYRGLSEKLTDIIQYEGLYYLPINTLCYYLNSRCYFNKGSIGIKTAALTYDEMIEKYGQYYINSSFIMQRDMNQSFDDMLVMYLWSGLANDYSAYNDEDMEIIYRKIVSNNEEKQNNFFDLVESYDELSTTVGYMTKPSKEIGKLIMGNDFDAVESFTKSMLESSDVTEQAVGGFLVFDEAISPVFDFGKKCIEDAKLISNYNYLYVDALEKGYLYTSETSLSYMQISDAKKIIRMCNNGRISDVNIAINALEVVESELKGEIASMVGKSSLSFLNAVITGLKLVGEFTGLNDDVDGYWEEWAFTAFQLEVRDIGADLMLLMNQSADSMTKDNIDSFRYNILLFLRTITFMNEEYKITTPGFVQTDLDNIAHQELYELWYDDINYLRDCCIDIEEVRDFYIEGKQITEDNDFGTNEASLYGNTFNNIANGGIACEYKGEIYYVGEDGRIYLFSEDGNSVKLNDANSIYLNIYNDMIYYCNLSDHWFCHVMNLDGSNDERLSENIAGMIYIKNGMLYYNGDEFNQFTSCGTGAFRFDIKNNETEKIADSWYEAIFGDEKMIIQKSTEPDEMGYSDSDYWLIDLETGEEEMLTSYAWVEEGYPEFQISNNEIIEIGYYTFFTDDYPKDWGWVHRVEYICDNEYNLPKTKESDSIIDVIINNEKIYALNYDYYTDETYICRTNFDGTELTTTSRKKIINQNNMSGYSISANMSIAGNYLFLNCSEYDYRTNERYTWFEIIDISNDESFQNHEFGEMK